MSTLRWAVIGASTIADAYMVDAIRRARGNELVGVYSRDEERGRAFAARHALGRVYRTPGDLRADAQLDAVYIGSANDHHVEDAVACGHAGLHVLCDKPLATTVEGASEIIAACAETGVRLGVNHNLRAAPAHRAVRELLREGAIGELRAIRLVHGTLLDRGPRGWRRTDPEGGGVALDITVHGADLVRFLTDDEVVEASALAATQLGDDTTIEDSLTGAWRLSSGPLVGFQDSFNHPHTATSLDLYGSGGAIHVADAMADDPVAVVAVSDADGVRLVELAPTAGLYVDVIARFAAAIDTGARPLCSGRDGRQALAIALATRDAARHGRRVPVAALTAQTPTPH